MQYTLGELIAALEREDPSQVVPVGFKNPHSYRGYYHDLAFEPALNVTVGEMLEAARSALGQTFEGYKGGEFTMTESTDVWIACYGSHGETIGPVLLSYMLGKPTPPPEWWERKRLQAELMRLQRTKVARRRATRVHQ